MTKRLRRPRAPTALAKLIGDVAADQVKEKAPDEGKNPTAVELGRIGGLIGGKARAAKLSPDRRKEIARAAALKRWTKE